MIPLYTGVITLHDILQIYTRNMCGPVQTCTYGILDKDSVIENKERNTGQLIHALKHEHLYFEKEHEKYEDF